MRKAIITIVLTAVVAVGGVAQDSVYVRNVIADLSSNWMFGRGMQHRGDSIAAAYLVEAMKEVGLKPAMNDGGYVQWFIFPENRTTPPLIDAGYRSKNLCGYLPGMNDTMIVFSAHYDHLGMVGDTIFPGAHDNASGVATVLDLAKTVAKKEHRYTYVFVFFGGEESGLIGSKYFADEPPIDLDKVKIWVNIDLFCGGEDGLMVVNANDRGTSAFVGMMEKLNEEGGETERIGRRDNAPNSDHWYVSAYCPAIFIYTMGGEYGGYHDSNDVCEKCGLERYQRHAGLIVSFVEYLEREDG